jgi:Uma2 family endonuclease
MPKVLMEVDVPDVKWPPKNLPETDGEPLESPWHFAQIALLIDLVHCWFKGRDDYFVGGNMFIYYSWSESKKQDYKGPDFFFVKEVERQRHRQYWAIWDEGGKYPNLMIELLSPTTAKFDKTTKKTLYEQTFRTPEYFWYDPDTQELTGWRMKEGSYQVIETDNRGWMWCEQLELWIGKWKGTHMGLEATWLRFYQENGQLVLLEAEAARLQAEIDRKKAEEAQAELTRMKALLAEKGVSPS